MMEKQNFQTSHGQFGRVLAEELAKHHISASAVVSDASMMKQRIFDMLEGKGDYRLSAYVRIVAALRYFFDDPSEYARVRRRLIDAAFDDSALGKV